MNMLLGETLFEGAKFLVMIVLLAVGVFVGGKIKTNSDLKKAQSKSAEANK